MAGAKARVVLLAGQRAAARSAACSSTTAFCWSFSPRRPRTMRPSSRHAGAAWQNPAGPKAQAAPRPRAQHSLSLLQSTSPWHKAKPPTAKPGHQEMPKVRGRSSGQHREDDRVRGNSTAPKGGCLQLQHFLTAAGMFITGQPQFSSQLVPFRTPLQL